MLGAPAVAMTKQLPYCCDGMTWEQAMRIGVDVNTIARATDDCKAGVAKRLIKEK